MALQREPIWFRDAKPPGSQVPKVPVYVNFLDTSLRRHFLLTPLSFDMVLPSHLFSCRPLLVPQLLFEIFFSWHFFPLVILNLDISFNDIYFSYDIFLLASLSVDSSDTWHLFLLACLSFDIFFSCLMPNPWHLFSWHLLFLRSPSFLSKFLSWNPFFCGLFRWQQLPLDISFSGQLFILASQSGAFYLAFFLPFYLTVIIWHSIWHSVRKLIWHSVRFRRPQRSSASAFHSIPKAFTSPRCKNLSERNNDRMADNSLHFSTLLCSRLFPSLHRSSLLSSLLYILCSSVLLLNFDISQTSLLTFLDDCIYTSIYIYIHLYTSMYVCVCFKHVPLHCAGLHLYLKHEITCRVQSKCLPVTDADISSKQRNESRYQVPSFNIL